MTRKIGNFSFKRSNAPIPQEMFNLKKKIDPFGYPVIEPSSF